MTEGDPMHDLLAASLAWWKRGGVVVIEPDGALVIALVAAPGEPLRIARAPVGLPFRWQVTFAGRTRSLSSVAGVLRTVRSVLDPDWSGQRVVVAGA